MLLYQLYNFKPVKRSGVETSSHSEWYLGSFFYFLIILLHNFIQIFFTCLHLSSLSSPNLLHHLSFPSTLPSTRPVIIHHPFHFLFFASPVRLFPYNHTAPPPPPSPFAALRRSLDKALEEGISERLSAMFAIGTEDRKVLRNVFIHSTIGPGFTCLWTYVEK